MFTIAFGIIIAVVILSALPAIFMSVVFLVGCLLAFPKALVDTIRGK